MLPRFALIAAGMLGSTCALSATSVMAAGCDPLLMQQYRECSRVVDTLRPEKSGQQRVFASDGSEYTAGQALWMRGQMRKVERLCADGSQASQAQAAQTLAAIEELIRTHQHS